jgi:hypothetical protein
MSNSIKKKEGLKSIPNRETQVKKYQNIAPSQIFYNPNTIKWFKKKYNEDLIKKSIYSLFPNNCQPVMTEEEWTPQRILREFLTHYLKPEDKYKDIWINPKYFFSKDVYESILKLKEIFLQFDEDGSRKMEIDEMAVMFKTNHINVTEDDLCGLFFKGKKYRKEDINKLYLDFFQFMNFALSKSSDQDFRIFMRKVKEKILKEKELERIEEEKKKNNMEKQEEEVVDDLFVDEKKEPVFLPMNFNLLLDYFINKGKERKSQKKIRRAIKMMRNILTPGRYPEDDPDFVDEEEEGGDDNKEEDENEKKEKKEEDEYDRQLREINTMEIMEEFDKLFKMSYVSPASSLMEQPKQKEAQPKIDSSNTDFTKTKDFKKSFMKKKTMVPFKFGKKHFMDDAEVNSKGNRKFSSKRGPKGNGLSLNNEEDNFNSKISSNRSKLRNNDENNSEFKRRANKRTKTTKIVFDLNKLKNNLIEKSKQKEKEENEKKLMEEKKKNKKCMFFTNIIKNELEEPNIDEINWYYFNKYHSVSLAKKATEKKVMEFLKEKNKIRLKTSSKTNKKNLILPDINKNKIKGKDNKKVLKKPQSLDKLGPKQLLDSFGFRRRAYKTRFLY